MKHLLNKDFFQIAKDYAVNNPKMDAQTCFKRADEFLEEYENIIIKECKIFSEKSSIILPELTVKKEEDIKKYLKLKQTRDELIKFHRSTFLYRNKQRYLDSIMPELDF